MNPYEADPSKIPSTDRHHSEPLYGRYKPQDDDFRPDPKHVLSSSPSSLRYWADVLIKCDANNRIYENRDGGRDVFALGSVIVKSSHLKPLLDGRKAYRDYSLADANEIAATKLVDDNGLRFRVPEIYFADKINGRAVLVQERLPGVGLNIAWQYLSQHQKQSFKEQARDLLRQMYSIKCDSDTEKRHSYVVPDPDPVEHRGIQELERDIIFGSVSCDSRPGLNHNDVSHSNLIVDNDKIVGLVDWEMAGFFNWSTAREVHIRIRSPRKENFAALDLPQEVLNDILFWNDLYDFEPSTS